MSGGVGFGPVSELLAIAEALELRGVSPRVVTFSERQSALVEELGFQSTSLPGPVARMLPVVDYTLSDVFYANGFTDPRYLSSTVESLCALIRRDRSDVVVCVTNPAAVLAARRLSVASVALVAGPDLPNFESPLYERSLYRGRATSDLNACLAEMGVGHASCVEDVVFRWSDGLVAPTWPELDPVLSSQAEVQFVGPVKSVGLDLLGGPLPPRDLRNSVVVYLNRGSVNEAEAERILIRCAEWFSEDVVVWVGGDSTVARSVDRRILCVGRVPLSRWLNTAKLLVSGGGLVAMLSALERGVGTLCIPGMNAERFYNGQQFAHLNVAVVSDVHDFDTDRESVLTTQVGGLLSSDEPKRVSQGLGRLGGAGRAADIVVEVVSQR
jgi:UDP:flavonoid glycosyltransferase YjiC (YdhE family)